MLLNKNFQWINEPKLHAILQSLNDRNDQSWVDEYHAIKDNRNMTAKRNAQEAQRLEMLERNMRRHIGKNPTRDSLPMEVQIPHDLHRIYGASMADIQEHHDITPSCKEWWDIKDALTEENQHMRRKQAEWREEDRSSEEVLDIEAQGIVEFEDYLAMVTTIKQLKEAQGLAHEEVTHEEVIEAFENEFGCKLEHISEAMFFGVDWRIIQRDAIDGKDIIQAESQAKLYSNYEVTEMKREFVTEVGVN